jgi:hypothetical protein
VQVYTSDPNAEVSLSVELNPAPDSRHREAVERAIPPNGPLPHLPNAEIDELLLLSVRPAPGRRNVRWLIEVDGAIESMGRPVQSVSGSPDPRLGTGPRAGYVTSRIKRAIFTGDLQTLRNPEKGVVAARTALGYPIGMAVIPLSVQERRGTVRADFPSIGFMEYWDDHQVPQILEQPPSRRAAALLVHEPQPRVQRRRFGDWPLDASAYRRLHRGANATAFFVPKRVSTNVVYRVPPEQDLTDYRFDSINPAGYLLRNGELSWHGGTDLEPSFVAPSSRCCTHARTTRSTQASPSAWPRPC